MERGSLSPAAAQSARSEQTQGPGDLALPLAGHVTLDKLLKLFVHVFSSVK